MKHFLSIDDLDRELDALTEEKEEIVRGDAYRIELSLNWSEYREGRWTSRRTSDDAIIYTTSDKVARHYLTGWVGDDGVGAARVHPARFQVAMSGFCHCWFPP